MKIIRFLPAHNKIQFLTNITLYTQLYNVFSGTHLEHTESKQSKLNQKHITGYQQYSKQRNSNKNKEKALRYLWGGVLSQVQILSSRLLIIKRLDQKSDLFFIPEKYSLSAGSNSLFKLRFKPKLQHEYLNYSCLLQIKDTF